MKTLKNKIYEGFFDNIGGKEYIFLQELKNALEDWKTSSDKHFPINQLDSLCRRAQKENLDFDICIGNNSNSSFKRRYVTLIKFWNEYYNTLDDRPANNECWTVQHATTIDNAGRDAFNPVIFNCNVYRMSDFINRYVKVYAESKRNLIFKVRISLANPKHTKWM